MAKKYDGKTLAVSGIPATLKQRLKLEAVRQNRQINQVVFEILDANLPKFESIINDEGDASNP